MRKVPVRTNRKTAHSILSRHSSMTEGLRKPRMRRFAHTMPFQRIPWRPLASVSFLGLSAGTLGAIGLADFLSRFELFTYMPDNDEDGDGVADDKQDKEDSTYNPVTFFGDHRIQISFLWNNSDRKCLPTFSSLLNYFIISITVYSWRISHVKDQAWARLGRFERYL